MFGLYSGLVLGRTGPLPFFPRVRVPVEMRRGHMYVVGKTGKGKSKFLENCLFQDIASGRGCGVVDPHTDLVSSLLATLITHEVLDQREQFKRIVYINPSDHRYVVPFNVLAAPGQPYEVAQNVIEAFRRTWPESLWEAPHFSNVMLHGLLVLIKVNQTLAALPRLLLDRPFREELLRQAGDRDLSSFFHDRFDRWGKQQGAVMKESTLNKVTALTMNPHLRLMLGQHENRLNFRAIMDRGQVLLADLGRCDEESQRLLGNLITTGIEQATFSRHDTAPEDRTPFYLYLDEFHQFSAGSGSVKTLSKILSGARKFGLHLTLAHQYLGQLSEEMQAAIIGNTWTKVIFGVSETDANTFAQWVGLGNVDTEAVKHAAQTPIQHPVYASIAEQWHEWAAILANQEPRQAVVRDHRGKTRRLWTVPARERRNLDEAVDTAKLNLLKRYGRSLSAVSREIEQDFVVPAGSEVWTDSDLL